MSKHFLCAVITVALIGLTNSPAQAQNNAQATFTLPDMEIAPGARALVTGWRLNSDVAASSVTATDTVKETADLQTLPSQTRRAAVFLLRLARSLK